jgi:hypothetical protein
LLTSRGAVAICVGIDFGAISSMARLANYKMKRVARIEVMKRKLTRKTIFKKGVRKTRK